MIKYIKMTASSNFGNIFSVLIASAFLPFLPMEAIHLILLNLIYDVACMGIAWDHVDEDYLTAPRPLGTLAVSAASCCTWGRLVRFLTWQPFYCFILSFVPWLPADRYTLSSPIRRPRQLYMALFQSGWFYRIYVESVAGHSYAAYR